MDADFDTDASGLTRGIARGQHALKRKRRIAGETALCVVQAPKQDNGK